MRYIRPIIFLNAICAIISGLDQPAFKRNHLNADKLIDIKLIDIEEIEQR